MVKLRKKRSVFLLATLAVVSVMSWGVAAVITQGSMDEMMQMMREKMMNRPAAMMSADQAIRTRKQQR